MSMGSRLLRPAIGLGMAGLVSCWGSGPPVGGPGTSGGGSTGSQAIEVGGANQDEIESILSGFTLIESISQIGLGSVPGCPTSSASADTDGDGLPDDITFTFADPPCHITGFRGGTVSRTGVMRIEDTSPLNSTAFLVTLTNLILDLAASAPSKSVAVTRSGTRVRSGNADFATLSDFFNVAWQRVGRAVATIQRVAISSFVADTAGTIDPLQPLPSGTLTVIGTMTWKRGTEDFSFNLVTQTPVHYNATCTTTPQRVDGGELRANGPVNGINGYMRVLWSACGIEPTFTFVRVP